MPKKSKKSFESQLKNIKEDIKNYAISVTTTTAAMVRDELTETAYLAMDKFYSYEPIYYQRHWDAHNFINLHKRSNVRAIKKYYLNAHNKSVHGGVLLSPDADAKQYKSAMINVYTSQKNPVETYEVFDLVMNGFHGPASYGLHVYNPTTWAKVRRMQPSPLELVYAKRDKIVKNIDKYINRAKRIVGKKYGF